jgi:GNAT superfamily N-acetyltransferase
MIMSEPTFHPLTPERWPDLESLFGPRGATGGCWCMYWRLPRSEFELMKGEQNRQAFHSLVVEGPPPGILAYLDGKPAGWCAVSPRQEYTALARSRVLKPVDDQPVWSIGCFFVARAQRRQGLTLKLLQAAVDYAISQGARIVEGYPVEPASGQMPDVFAWTGFADTFRQAGFVEVVRRSTNRPIFRYPAP